MYYSIDNSNPAIYPAGRNVFLRGNQTFRKLQFFDGDRAQVMVWVVCGPGLEIKPLPACQGLLIKKNTPLGKLSDLIGLMCSSLAPLQ